MKYVFPLSLFLALALVGGAYLSQHSPSSATTPVSVATDANPSAPSIVPATAGGASAAAAAPTKAPGQPAGYTNADVAKHRSAASCWTSIDGSVYDVTAWINQHPGGAEAILSLCGVDGSAAFNAQHGGQRRPASELASFRIGALR